jgi:hypothetical protein
VTERDDERKRRARDERDEENRKLNEDERRLRQLRESWRERHSASDDEGAADDA